MQVAIASNVWIKQDGSNWVPNDPSRLDNLPASFYRQVEYRRLRGLLSARCGDKARLPTAGASFSTYHGPRGQTQQHEE